MILHLEADMYPEDSLDLLRSIAEVVEEKVETESKLKELLASRPFHTLILTLGLKIGEELMNAAPDLRFLVSPTTALDHIDVIAAEEKGIRVLSLRDASEKIVSVSSTAELTWGLLLSLVRGIPAADRSVRAGVWRREEFVGTQLSGKTIGIVGFGRLGKIVARYAQAFNMVVFAHDPYLASEDVRQLGVKLVSDSELLKKSDFISLHMSLNDSSIGWLSRERLAQCKPGVFVINTARGQLVDEEGLSHFLLTGRVAGVGVDVLGDDSSWGSEGHVTPLRQAQEAGANVVITPHIGGYSEEAIVTTRRLISEIYAIHWHSDAYRKSGN